MISHFVQTDMFSEFVTLRTDCAIDKKYSIEFTIKESEVENRKLLNEKQILRNVALDLVKQRKVNFEHSANQINQFKWSNVNTLLAFLSEPNLMDYKNTIKRFHESILAKLKFITPDKESRFHANYERKISIIENYLTQKNQELNRQKEVCF